MPQLSTTYRLDQGVNQLDLDHAGVYLLCVRYPHSATEFQGIEAVTRIRSDHQVFFKGSDVSIAAIDKTRSVTIPLFRPVDNSHYLVDHAHIVQLVAAFWVPPKTALNIKLRSENKQNLDITPPHSYELVHLGSNPIHPIGNYVYRATRPIKAGVVLSKADYQVDKFPPEVIIDGTVLPSLLIEFVCRSF